MKKKTYKIFGVSLVVMLIASLLVFAIPTSAQPYGTKDNAWEYKDFVAGMDGGWVYDPGISSIGPIAKDKDGATIYAYVMGASAPAGAPGDFFISKDGYSWMTSADPGAYWKVDTNPAVAGVQAPGAVVDMVCSGRDLETIYATDGNYVYKSIDGAKNWSIIAQENLELFLMGDCGIHITGFPITCIDVGYNGSAEPILFIGTRYAGNHYPSGHALEYQPIVGTVLWINEETYPAEWYDLGLPCYGCCDISTITATASEIIGAGDGTTDIFSTTLDNYPVDPGSVVVTDDNVIETFTDDGAGNLTGDNGGSGTIDYFTGAIYVDFGTAPLDIVSSTAGEAVGTGDGVTVTFSTTLANPPIDPGSLSITDGTETFTETGTGVLTGSLGGTGTIDYATGAVTVTFFLAPAAATPITAAYDTDNLIKVAYDYYSGGMGCFDAFSVAAAPNFADTGKAYVLVSRPTTMTFDLTVSNNVVVTANSAGATLTFTDLPAEVTVTSTGTIVGNTVTLAPSDTCTFTCDGTGSGTADVQFSVTAGQVASIVPSDAYITVCEAATQIISTVGTTCSWSLVSELFWDCDSDNNFEIRHGSRFAFPDDFADANELFIGVTGVYPYGPGGDVYSTTDTPGPDIALDRNVQGFSTGCLGFFHANICSLDMKGSAADGSLIAGAYDTFEHQLGTSVFYSSDAGWTWALSKKNPTGVALTYVLWFGSTAVAGTTGCDCGFSMSCGDEIGEYWNQTALIAINPTDRDDMDQSPEYVDGSSTVYMLFYGYDRCDYNSSLFRYDGVHWERVFSSSIYASPGGNAIMDWVEVSPDFNTTGCLYLASTDFEMYRSMDRGCSWAPLSYPCEPRPWISAWIVVDEETVLAAGCSGGAVDATGIVFKTTRHGTRPWSEFPIMGAHCGVDFDLSPNIGSDGQVLLGDEDGQVFISEDTGSTWEKVWTAPGGPPCNVLPSADTYVQFDPSYGTGSPDAAGMNMIYAAAGNVIARCNIDSDAPWAGQCWEKIKDDVCYASGIDANGDTALYVSDAGAAGGQASPITVTGTIEVKCAESYYDWWSGDLELTDKEVTPISGTFNDGELVSIIEYNLVCECLSWSLVGDEGCSYICEDSQITGEIGIQGVDSDATGKITISADQCGVTVEGCDCACNDVMSSMGPIGGFESGLSGWQVDGWGASVEALTSAAFTPTITPTEGTSMALVSCGPGILNAATDGDIDASGVNDSDMSTLEACFTTDEPTILSFDWGWLTSEEDQGSPFDDFFQVTLDGVVILSGSVFGFGPSPYADVATDDVWYTVSSAGPTNGCSFDDGFSGWQTYTSPGFLAAGQHRLEFLVADQANHIVDSGLLVDNVCLDAVSLAGPVPSETAIEVISSFLTIDVPGAPLAACPAGVWRTLNPLDMIPPGVPFSAVIEFELLTDATIQGANAHPLHGYYTSWTDNLWLTTHGSSNVLWMLDANNRTYVWNWVDPLANPVILEAPACGGAQLVSPSGVTLSWQALDGATEYEIELYQYCPQCPEERIAIDVPNSTDTCVIVEGLAPGTEHFWRVRVASGAPFLSKWSNLCSFTTALGGIPSLCSPVCGSADNILTTNFSWDEVPGAASYELQIVAASADGTADFTGATTLTTDVNAIASIPGLEYSTTYFWRVRAVTGGVPGAWSVCVFTTMDEPVEPVPPADLVVNIPAEEVITPTWMWVLIGIGAALTIAVIILIVTTRRVP